MLIQISLEEILKDPFSCHGALRWGGVGFDIVNNFVLVEKVESPLPLSLPAKLNLESVGRKSNLGVMVIPTGLGCSIGGYGGDANLCANLLATQFDYLIVNPNVVNGGAWQNLAPNMFYVEGAALDLFLQGRLALRPVKKNKIGLILDRGIPEKIIARELEVLKAAQTIWGLDVIGYELTENTLSQKVEILPGNLSSGKIENPETLHQAAQKLKDRGATALAILTKLPLLPAEENSYLKGKGPDPIGGLEAICSHLITRSLLLPCAHAPAFEDEDEIIEAIDPRVSPEICSYSFLPSVLKGLSKAPKLVQQHELQTIDFTMNDLAAFVGPADCWLGESFLSAARNENISSYAVRSNTTGIGLTPEKLHLEKVTNCSNYLELIGHLVKDDLGIVMSSF